MLKFSKPWVSGIVPQRALCALHQKRVVHRTGGWSGTIISTFSSDQSLSPVRLFATPWTAAHQASLPITNSRSLLKLIFITLVMPSSHLILCIPFSSCLHFCPTSGSFPMSPFFASGGQSIGVHQGFKSIVFFRI